MPNLTMLSTRCNSDPRAPSTAADDIAVDSNFGLRAPSTAAEDTEADILHNFTSLVFFYHVAHHATVSLCYWSFSACYAVLACEARDHGFKQIIRL